MNMELTQANFALDAHRMMALTKAQGVEVKVLTGQVWLTMEGDRRDIFLEPGDAHSIERNGLTLINAIEPSVLHVLPPQAQAAAWKRWLRLFWEGLVSVGEARVRARIARGMYDF